MFSFAQRSWCRLRVWDFADDSQRRQPSEYVRPAEPGTRAAFLAGENLRNLARPQGNPKVEFFTIDAISNFLSLLFDSLLSNQCVERSGLLAPRRAIEAPCEAVTEIANQPPRCATRRGRLTLRVDVLEVLNFLLYLLLSLLGFALVRG